MDFKIKINGNRLELYVEKTPEELMSDTSNELIWYMKNSKDTLPKWKLDAYTLALDGIVSKYKRLSSGYIQSSKKGKYFWSPNIKLNRADEIKKIIKNFEKLKIEYEKYNEEE